MHRIFDVDTFEGLVGVVAENRVERPGDPVDEIDGVCHRVLDGAATRFVSGVIDLSIRGTGTSGSAALKPR